MNKKYLFPFVILVIACLSTIAQGRDEAVLIQVNEQLRKAMIEGDRTALEDLVMEKLSYGHSGGHIDNKKEFVDKIASGQSDFVSIDLTEQTIVVSKKTAIVRHILKARTNDSGKPGEVYLRIMLVWQKHKGDWKLLGRQAVKII